MDRPEPRRVLPASGRQAWNEKETATCAIATKSARPPSTLEAARPALCRRMERRLVTHGSNVAQQAGVDLWEAAGSSA